MDNNKYYVLTAKTCTTLDQKFGVISKQELDILSEDSKEKFIIEGPMDQLGALILKDEKIKDMIIHHVRWSIMREGYNPPGTFNGIFVDNEDYLVVERGGKENWFTSKRGFLVQPGLLTSDSMAIHRLNNELDKHVSVLYTDLCEKVYAEGDSLGKSEPFPGLGEPLLPSKSESGLKVQEESKQDDETVSENRMSSSIANRAVIQEGDFIKFNVTLKKKPLEELTERVQKKVFDLVQADTDLQGLEFPTFKLTIAGIYVRVSFKIKGFNELHNIQYKCIKNNEYIYKLYPVEIVRMIKTTIMEAGKLPQEVKLDGHVDIPQEEKPKRDLHDYIIDELPKPKLSDTVVVEDYDPRNGIKDIKTTVEKKEEKINTYTLSFYKERAKIFDAAFVHRKDILNDQSRTKAKGNAYRFPTTTTRRYCGEFRYATENGNYAINMLHSIARDADLIMHDNKFDRFRGEIVKLMVNKFMYNSRVVAMKYTDLNKISVNDVKTTTEIVIEMLCSGDFELSKLVKDENSFYLMRIAIIILSDYVECYNTTSNHYGYINPQSVYDSLKSKFDEKTIYALMASLGYHNTVLMNWIDRNRITIYRTRIRVNMTRDQFPTNKTCGGTSILPHIEEAMSVSGKYNQYSDLIKMIFNKANHYRHKSIYELVLFDKDIDHTQISDNVMFYVGEIAYYVNNKFKKEE